MLNGMLRAEGLRLSEPQRWDWPTARISQDEVSLLPRVAGPRSELARSNLGHYQAVQESRLRGEHSCVYASLSDMGAGWRRTFGVLSKPITIALFMALVADQSVMMRKTRELCEALLAEPEFHAIRLKLDQFMINDEVKGQYQELGERSEYLQHKQEQGLTLENSEIEDYEMRRNRFLENPVARGFMDAQKSLQEMQETVNRYVSKTIELGRVPESSDMESSCGTGCGCH